MAFYNVREMAMPSEYLETCGEKEEQELESPNSEKENAAPDYEGKKKRARGGSRSSSAGEYDSKRREELQRKQQAIRQPEDAELQQEIRRNQEMRKRERLELKKRQEREQREREQREREQRAQGIQHAREIQMIRNQKEAIKHALKMRQQQQLLAAAQAPQQMMVAPPQQAMTGMQYRGSISSPLSMPKVTSTPKLKEQASDTSLMDVQQALLAKESPNSSTKHKCEHNGSGDLEKANSKIKEGLNKDEGSSGGSDKQRASSSNTISVPPVTQLKKRIPMRSATLNSTDRSNIITCPRQVRVEDKRAAGSRRRPNQLKRPSHSISVQGSGNVVICGSVVPIKARKVKPVRDVVQQSKCSDDTKPPLVVQKGLDHSDRKVKSVFGEILQDVVQGSDHIEPIGTDHPNLKRKIFISFSFKDSDKALDLVGRIEKRIGAGSCWICTTDIGAGDILDAEIAKGINKAAVILCLVSQNFTDSLECEKEVLLARQEKKKFIPVHLSRVKSPLTKSDGQVSPMRMAFAQLLYIQLYKDEEGSQDNFEKIISKLQHILALAVQ